MSNSPLRAASATEALIALQAWFRDCVAIRVPVQTRPDSLGSECFANVQRAVDEFGGARVLGWALWWHNAGFIDAEAHAVWLQPDGSYLDPSVQSPSDREICFVPDPGMLLPGPDERILNRRRVVGTSPMLPDLVRLFDLRDLAAQALIVPGTDLQVPLSEYDGQMAAMLVSASSALETALLRHERCVCGGKKDYGTCHRDEVRRFTGALESAVPRMARYVLDNLESFKDAEILDIRERPQQ